MTDDESPMIQWKVAEPPKPVGYWCLYECEGYTTKLAMYSKPADEQIKNTEELLGWKWSDK